MGREQEISREAVDEALSEFRALGRTAFLKKYGFGKAREYFVLDPISRNLFDSKAIAGAAYGYQIPESGHLRADQFSGGEDTVAARLTELGFEVIIGGVDWSEEEVRIVVSDYFDMLQLESEGKPYAKAAHNLALRGKLRSRSKGSVESKHQNISAVLNDLGLPFIPGYKPRGHAQGLLRQVIRQYLDESPSQFEQILSALEDVPDSPFDTVDYDSALVAAPLNASIQSEARKRIPRKFDFASRDERNRNLGRRGERWVIEYERVRLERAGRSDLLTTIEWVADTRGDGSGYDIRSKDPDGSDLFIEVKTTNGSELTPFFLTANEIECASDLASRFRLYRVFDFSSSPRLFIIPGPLDDRLQLEPSEFRVRFRASD
jgi:hypothetical protein